MGSIAPRIRMTLAKTLKRQELLLLDRARCHTWSKSMLSKLTLPLGCKGPSGFRLGVLDRFLRFNPGSPMSGLAFRKAVELSRNTDGGGEEQTLERSIILKRPGPGGEMGY